MDAGMRRSRRNPIFLPGEQHWLSLTQWQRKSFVPVHWEARKEVVFAIRGGKAIIRAASLWERTPLKWPWPSRVRPCESS